MDAIRGYGITSDTQLRDFAKMAGIKLNYIGYAENITSKPMGFNIINLGDNMMGGSHWVLWYNGEHESCYFDSYSGPPEDKVVKYSTMPLFINNKQVQKYDGVYCGIWAITAAAHMNKAKDKKRALIEFINQYKVVH